MINARDFGKNPEIYPSYGWGWNAIAGIATIGIFVRVLVSAARDTSGRTQMRPFARTANYQNWKVTASVDGSGRRVSLADTTLADVFVSSTDANLDGRFDEIRLALPKGHPLEVYANLDSLEAAYAFAAAQREGGLNDSRR